MLTWLENEIQQEKMIPQNQARKVAVGKVGSSVGGTADRTSSMGESSTGSISCTEVPTDSPRTYLLDS